MNSIKEKVPYPSDWKVKKLGELGSFLKGKGISKSETIESGLPCIRYGEIYTRHHDYIKEFYSFVDEDTANKSTEIMKGDILFAGSGETAEEIGKSVAYLHEEKAYAGGDIIILRTKDVNSKYLAFALNEGRLAKERAKLGQGHSVVHIYPKELKELIIHLPSDNEQQKIVSILSTWDKAIELKEKLIEQKKEQKKGLMQKLLTGEVRMPGFNGKWKKVKIKDLSKVVTGTTPSTINKNYYQEGIYPWITPTDINESKYISSSARNLTKIGLEKGRFVPAGSLLITCIASIGKNAILTTDGSCNQQINAILPSTNHSNEFLYYRLTMDTQCLETLAGKSATAIINKNTFENYQIDIPIFAEQLAIAKVLSQIDQFIELAIAELEMLKQQKKGLMQILLTGKVRVKV